MDRFDYRPRLSSLSPPLIVLLVGGAIAILLLWLTPSLPIGTFYDDLTFFLDAAYRIDRGQLPNVDFFPLVGPLPYYALWLAKRLFPNAHPVMAGQLSYALVILPFLALALSDIKSRAKVFLIGAVFVALALFPANLYYDVIFNRGIDAFGLYNRQGGLLLYVLVTALWWSESKWITALVSSVALTGLLLTKVTLFAPAFALLVYMTTAGRVSWHTLVAVALSLGVVLGGLQVTTGIPSAYLSDMAALGSMNSDIWHRININALRSQEPVALLAFVAAAGLCRDREKLLAALPVLRRHPIEGVRSILESESVSFVALCVVAFLIECQNTGSHSYAFVFPAALRLAGPLAWSSPAKRAVTVTVAAFAIALAAQMAARTVRFVNAALRLPTMASQQAELAPFRASARMVDINQGNEMLDVVRQEKRAYQAFAEHGLNPAMSLLSTTNYQIYYMLTVAAGVRALRKFEEQNGRLESVATIDNVDPFSMLTGKEPVKGIQIAYDHTRTVPTVRIPQLVERFSTAEGILVPLCPVTDARYALRTMFAGALAGRREVAIDPCWSIYLRAKV